MPGDREGFTYGAERVLSLLRTERLGRDLRFLDTTASTQEVALALAAGGATEGTVVIAEEQSAGMGRRGRTWHSGRGLGIWLSMVLRPPLSSSQCQALSTWAGLAVLDSLGVCGWKSGLAGLKWPNDVVVGRRKLCGILIDAKSLGDSVSYAVLGLGLNTGHCPGDFPAELASTATSMRMVTGVEPERALVLSELLLCLERSYGLAMSAGGRGALASRAARASVLSGRPVRVIFEGTTLVGKAVGLDGDGALMVEDALTGAVQTVRAGDVQLIESEEDGP